MLLKITNPDVLAEYPHLAPPKLRVTDMVARDDGSGGTIYEMDPGTPEAGHGRLVECVYCGARLRAGEPHTATLPVPHTAYDQIVVVEPEFTEQHYTGHL